MCSLAFARPTLSITPAQSCDVHATEKSLPSTDSGQWSGLYLPGTQTASPRRNAEGTPLVPSGAARGGGADEEDDGVAGGSGCGGLDFTAVHLGTTATEARGGGAHIGTTATEARGGGTPVGTTATETRAGGAFIGTTATETRAGGAFVGTTPDSASRSFFTRCCSRDSACRRLCSGVSQTSSSEEEAMATRGGGGEEEE